MNEGRRLRRVVVDFNFFIQQITTGWHIGDDGFAIKCIQGVPEGARLKNAYHDIVTDSLQLIVEHESFELVKHGEIIPPLYVMIGTEKIDATTG